MTGNKEKMVFTVFDSYNVNFNQSRSQGFSPRKRKSPGNEVAF